MVTVDPEIVATDSSEDVYVIGNLESEEAPKSNTGSSYVFEDITGKFIICDALLTVNV